MNPDVIVCTMRQILREQCTMSYMNKEAGAYIMVGGLLRLDRWPAWIITLTDAGRDYLAEHDHATNQP
jgi:hypothetical protein